jgi:hypothetical protein
VSAVCLNMARSLSRLGRHQVSSCVAHRCSCGLDSLPRADNVACLHPAADCQARSETPRLQSGGSDPLPRRGLHLRGTTASRARWRCPLMRCSCSGVSVGGDRARACCRLAGCGSRPCVPDARRAEPCLPDSRSGALRAYWCTPGTSPGWRSYAVCTCWGVAGMPPKSSPLHWRAVTLA